MLKRICALILIVFRAFAAPENGVIGRPIQRAIVIFGENISVARHFGTCPNAFNPSNESACIMATGLKRRNRSVDNAYRRLISMMSLTIEPS